MISRDRFEVILESISKGTAIENARNRLEMIFSAIAEKIGTGGGGGTTITKEVIGTYDNPSNQHTYIETAKDMSDYDYLEITFKWSGQWASAPVDVYRIEICQYVEGKCGMTALSTGSGTSNPVRWEYTNSKKLTMIYGPSNSLWISQIVGVKITSEA